jgi:putative intracellular protease/amidase
MEDLATTAAAAAESAAPAPRTVHLYVFDGFADWEAAFAVAGIHNPQFQREPGRWQVKTVGPGRHAVPRSMGGVSVLPDMAVEDLQPDDSAMLILPGGSGAICGATAALARAGWLESRPHTSNALAYLKGTGYGGAELYRDAAVVRDGTLITAGGMAPIEFAAAIFDLLGIYEPEALEAWVQLYKTGQSAYFAKLARAAEAGPEASS